MAGSSSSELDSSSIPSPTSSEVDEHILRMRQDKGANSQGVALEGDDDVDNEGRECKEDRERSGGDNGADDAKARNESHRDDRSSFAAPVGARPDAQSLEVASIGDTTPAQPVRQPHHARQGSSPRTPPMSTSTARPPPRFTAPSPYVPVPSIQRLPAPTQSSTPRPLPYLSDGHHVIPVWHAGALSFFISSWGTAFLPTSVGEQPSSTVQCFTETIKSGALLPTEVIAVPIVAGKEHSGGRLEGSLLVRIAGDYRALWTISSPIYFASTT
ncbi:hypothetical protein BDZ90DRAFT_258782 [Jaminaea rosea]|uniref:Uncharacterized protein n=1 Tax=Jaminaea rosea TaxID=1569628 RepID=A0A316UWI8_9BASI|nr:hypothetical protein BDZ90DRAFT_258782 [Jaminaea rosea]PWN28691.1 hypothetical protein BDZ90DRAFT_258782 [Jaminaea rosea]